MIRNSILSILIVCLLANTGNAQEEKAILVTGASSGIGRALAEKLAADGYFVYAGARKQADLDALNAIRNVQAIELDVTIQEQIDKAVETVRQEDRGLYGLVNNAGVLVFGPLIEVSEDEMQFQMDVNVFGPYRISKAFAPLIIESRGRITTIGSISGILSGRFVGPYTMSKHAIEAYVDTLAAEMQKFGVHVSVIEPGTFGTQIYKSWLRRLEQQDSMTDGSLFEDELRDWLNSPFNNKQHPEPDVVVTTIMQALFEEDPRRRYMIVPNQGEAELTIRKAIEELVQLNERQQYSYDRDALISMLDEALPSPADD